MTTLPNASTATIDTYVRYIREYMVRLEDGKYLCCPVGGGLEDLPPLKGQRVLIEGWVIRELRE
jgi:hypothetical protein